MERYQEIYSDIYIYQGIYSDERLVRTATNQVSSFLVLQILKLGFSFSPLRKKIDL